MVTETVVVPAPLERVWEAFVDAGRREAWWSYLRLDGRPGGRVEERWTDTTGREVVTSGRVLEAVAPTRLRMSWADEGWPAATEVEVELAPCPSGTRVTVRHSGWERLPEGEALAAAHAAGWRAHLDDLRRVLSAAAPP
jgi:uncharacterized protein YndB with AHSA1/START domain